MADITIIRVETKARSRRIRFTIRQGMILIAILAVVLAFPLAILLAFLALAAMATPLILLVPVVAPLGLLSVAGALVYLAVMKLKKPANPGPRRSELGMGGGALDAEIRYL